MPGRSGRDEMQGVANVRSYGAPLGTPTPSNAADRPKVGPAPDATRHAALEQQGLYRKPVGAPASSPAARPSPQPTPAASPANNPTRDLSLGTAAQRIQSYPGRVNQAIDEQSK